MEFVHPNSNATCQIIICKAALQPACQGLGTNHGLCNENGNPVPLKSISVTADIRGHIAVVSSSLTYFNEEEEPVEAVFIFPVDDGSAVFKFTADIDDRHIVAEIQEKEQAELTYQDAIDSGITAAIIKQTEHSADVFKCTLGNLPPNKEAMLSFTYAIELPIEADGRVRFTLPTVLNPRYNPDTIQSSCIRTPSEETPTFIPASNTPYTFTISASVESNIKVQSVTSDKLPLDVTFSDSKYGAQVALGEEFQFDHDLTFYIQYEEAFHPQVVFEKGTPEAESMYLREDVVMLSFNPDLKEVAMATSGEYIFVVDCSGSMGGDRIEMAQEALLLFLKSLPQNCTFNIVRFGSFYKMLFPSGSKQYTEKSVSEAMKLQKNLGAGMGGTEIYNPLKDVFKNPSKELIRNVFVLTDGQVTNSGQVIGLIKTNAKNARVFSLGIGTGVSTTLVNGMVRAGNGIAEFVTDTSKIQAKVISLLKSAMQPCVSQISLNWDLPPDVTPFLIPEEVPSVIIAGNRLTLYALLQGVNQDAIYAPSKVTLKGDCERKPVTFDFSFTLSDDMDARIQTIAPVHRLACQKKIKLLEDSFAEHTSKLNDDCFGYEGEIAKLPHIREQIVEVSRHANLISKMTAFVAVDKEGGKVDSKMIEQPCPVPTVSQGFIEAFTRKSLRSCSLIGGGIQIANNCVIDNAVRVYSKKVCRSAPGAVKAKKKSRSLFSLCSGGRSKKQRYSPPYLDANKDTAVPMETGEEEEEEESGSSAAKPIMIDDSDDRDIPRDQMITVVTLQEISGHWKCTQQLCECLGVTEDKIKSTSPVQDICVWCTLAVVYWLRDKCAERRDEWQMIEAKALMWLEAQDDVKKDGCQVLLDKVKDLVFPN